MRWSRSCVASGVRAEVGLAGGSAAPMQNVDPSSAPPGLPPLVFVDQPSGGVRPRLSSPPMRLGGYNQTVICLFSGDVDRSNVVQPHTLAKVLRSSLSQQFPLAVSAPHPTVLDIMEGQTRGEAPNLPIILDGLKTSRK